MPTRDKPASQKSYRFYGCYAAAFILINLFLWQKGSTNPASRLAAMAAFCETHTFQIDAYIQEPLVWTYDWSKSPNQHYYSNKAPGAILAGLPVFWLTDFFITTGIPSAQERNNKRRQHLFLYNMLVSMGLQIIPMAIVAGFVVRWLSQLDLDVAAIHFSLLAMLFANTAGLLMNTYFGHAMSAWTLLAAVMAWILGRAFVAGLFIGLSATTDYSAVFVALIFFVLACMERKKWKDIRRLFFGMLIPLSITLTYYTACFGKPWTTPLQFENPIYLEQTGPHSVLLGMFALMPKPMVLLNLLFGTERGILVTQPWVLLVLTDQFMKIVRSKKTDTPWLFIRRFGVLGFIAVLLLNTMFNGWHGGLMIGPRYLCLLFPVLALLSADTLHSASTQMSMALWGTLFITLIVSALVYATTLYAPHNESLWPTLLWVWQNAPNPHPGLRAGGFVLGILGAAGCAHYWKKG